MGSVKESDSLPDYICLFVLFYLRHLHQIPTFMWMKPTLQTLHRHTIRVRIEAQLKPLKRPLLTSMVDLPGLTPLVIENHV